MQLKPRMDTNGHESEAEAEGMKCARRFMVHSSVDGAAAAVRPSNPCFIRVPSCPFVVLTAWFRLNRIHFHPIYYWAGAEYGLFDDQRQTRPDAR